MPVQCTWSDLLDACQARQWLTAETARKAAWLLESGLHPEQVLLGTGLITLDQFGELVNEGLVVPHDPGACPVTEGPQTTREVLAMLGRVAKEHHAFQIRCLERADHVTVACDDHPFAQTVATFPRAVLSALIYRLKRSSGDDGWTLSQQTVGTGRVILLTRTSSAPDRTHPLHWTNQWNLFRTLPRGLLVIVRPDAYIREQVRRWTPSEETDEGTNLMRFEDPQTTEDDERISHAILAHVPAIVTTHRPAEEAPWVSHAIQAGIPVRVIRGSLSPHGRQWTAYALPAR